MKRSLSFCLGIPLLALAGNAAAIAFGSPLVNEDFRKLAFDAAGNVYAAGTSPTATDLFAASFTSAGLARWNGVTDGGFARADFPLTLTIQNNDYRLGYYTKTGTNFDGYGTQVIDKNTGAFGLQSTISPGNVMSLINACQLQDVTMFVGYRPAPLSDAFIVRFEGALAPTVSYYAAGGSTQFADIVRTGTSTYIAGLDPAGIFLAKWDVATNTPIWRCALPANFLPSKVGLALTGDIFVGGTMFNADADFGVCKISSTGVLLAQSSWASAGFQDQPMEFTVMANQPVVAGFRTDAAGVQTMAGCLFSADLAKSTPFSDANAWVARCITSDTTGTYIGASSLVGPDYRLYRIGTNGIVWSTTYNQSVDTERILSVAIRNGVLIAGGSSGGDALITRIDPANGNVIW